MYECVPHTILNARINYNRTLYTHNLQSKKETLSDV